MTKMNWERVKREDVFKAAARDLRSRGSWLLLTSSWAGVCSKCSKAYQRNDPIFWNKKTKAVMCAPCHTSAT